MTQTEQIIADPPKIKYYYYTKWTLPYDIMQDDAPRETVYHSTWVTEQSPKEFLSNCTNDVIFFQRFSSRKEMEQFAQSVGLR